MSENTHDPQVVDADSCACCEDGKARIAKLTMPPGCTVHCRECYMQIYPLPDKGTTNEQD